MTDRLGAFLAGLVLAGSLAALAVPEALSQRTISGPARVIDGDSLVIAGQRVRLFGIDAPELGQTCGTDWCGKAARAEMERTIGDAAVTCVERGSDHYGRLVAQCTALGSDLGQHMVAVGMAVAYRRYSTAYVDAENAAKAEHLGIWGGTFEMPEDWRRTHKR
jgi:endonuclease YncB( thermonuclease family)